MIPTLESPKGQLLEEEYLQWLKPRINPKAVQEDDYPPNSKYVEYLRLKAEEFHLPGEHDQSTHGNRGPSSNADSAMQERIAQRQREYENRIKAQQDKTIAILEKAAANKGTDTSTAQMPTSKAVAGQMPRKEVGVAVRDAFKSIEQVHTIPADATPIPIRTDRQIKDKASYYYYAPPGKKEVPDSIKINPGTGTPTLELSLAHEFGHYLDSQVFDRGIKTPHKSPEMVALNAAIQTSQATRELNKTNDRLTKYYQSPVEQFGRAYAQWIATRSGNTKMLEQLELLRTPGRKVAGSSLHSQWSDDDFVPIARAFDRLFKSKGMIK